MKSFNFIIALVTALLACVSAGIKLWLAYDLWAIACYAAIILALPVASLMHELGHMLCGAAVKIKAVPAFSLFGSSSVKLIPKTDKNLRPKLFFTAAGGPAVNFIITVVCLLPIFFDVLPAWVTVFLPSSVYLFMLNIVNAENTDGRILSELIRNTDEAKVMLAVLTVQAQVLNGKPINEVDEALLFDLPVIMEDDPAFISLTELRYEYFSAKGEEEKAKQYKQRFEELEKEYL